MKDTLLYTYQDAGYSNYIYEFSYCRFIDTKNIRLNIIHMWEGIK